MSDSRPSKIPRLLLLAACVQHQLRAAAYINIINQRVDHRTLPRPGGCNAARGRRPVYEETTWGRMLREEENALRDPQSPQAKLFRLRFLYLTVYS